MAARKTISPRIKRHIDRYIEQVNDKMHVTVHTAILFGSWATGRHTEDSDIDIGIVSEEFGADPVTETQQLLKLTRFVDARIEPLAISRSDFENDATPLVCEMKKNGLIVAS